MTCSPFAFVYQPSLQPTPIPNLPSFLHHAVCQQKSTRFALRFSLRLLFITASFPLLSSFTSLYPAPDILGHLLLCYHEALATMSSLLSSVLSYAGASLPVVFLAGLLWVTATALDSEASHPTRKLKVPGGWDSHYDEHHLFFSRSPSRLRPSSVVETFSSTFMTFIPRYQPRPIFSSDPVISRPSRRSSPRPYRPSPLSSRPYSPSPLSSSRPLKKRPSARASSPGVSQTSTLPKTYSHLTSSQYRSLVGDEAVSKACRKGPLTFEAVDNVFFGKWSLSRAIDQSAKALATPGRKNCPTAAASPG